MSTSNVSDIGAASTPLLSSDQAGPAASRRSRRKSAEERDREERERLIKELELPFDAALIHWKVFQTQRRGRELFGLVWPYADTRAYSDRLNALFTTEGWENNYEVFSTTPAKISSICRLNIKKLGCHSATGEEWSRNENATTAAEAQAFKRACSCFGLGRYLYSFEGEWLQLDSSRRPVKLPVLPAWATAEGWRNGLRPPQPTPIDERQGPVQNLAPNDRVPAPNSERRPYLKNVVREIENMHDILGARLYRGILKQMAQVWQPSDIKSIDMQRKVLTMMASAARGLKRYQVAAGKLDETAQRAVLRAVELDSIKDVKDMQELQELVACMERAAKAKAGPVPTEYIAAP